MEDALTDWSLVQSFLAVAEAGSLSAAARRLERSQPTLGRHIQMLEARLDVVLFDRHARGLALSDAGHQLLPMAREMRARMNEITLTAAGRAQRLEGTVRITASVFASHHLLPSILATIRATEPTIELELVPSDTSENLLFRAADIAVRMYRPTQLDVVTRHVTDLPLVVCAAKSYLDRRGRPERADDLLDHDLVGYDENPLIIHAMRAFGWEAERHDFATRCDNQATYWELVRAGCGVGFSQAGVAQKDPKIEVLDLGIEIAPLPVWLASHKAIRHTPRVARVWEMLLQGLVALN